MKKLEKQVGSAKKQTMGSKLSYKSLLYRTYGYTKIKIILQNISV